MCLYLPLFAFKAYMAFPIGSLSLDKRTFSHLEMTAGLGRTVLNTVLELLAEDLYINDSTENL